MTSVVSRSSWRLVEGVGEGDEGWLTPSGDSANLPSARERENVDCVGFSPAKAPEAEKMRELPFGRTSKY